MKIWNPAGFAAMAPILCASIFLQPQSLWAQTGTHLRGGVTRPTVIQLKENSRLVEVAALIASGQPVAAAEEAQGVIASLQRMTGADASLVPSLYAAYNALCIAETQRRATDAAIAACGRAMELRPERWTAINNRATALYSAGQYAAALRDYRRALEVAPARDANVRATIEHNISLTEANLSQ